MRHGHKAFAFQPAAVPPARLAFVGDGINDAPALAGKLTPVGASAAHNGATIATKKLQPTGSLDRRVGQA